MDYSRLPLQPHFPLPTPTPLTTMDIDGNTQNSIFRLPLPHISTITLRTAGIYLSGVFYSLAFYSLLDSALFSKSNANGSVVHVAFLTGSPLLSRHLACLSSTLLTRAGFRSRLTFPTTRPPSGPPKSCFSSGLPVWPVALLAQSWYWCSSTLSPSTPSRRWAWACSMSWPMAVLWSQVSSSGWRRTLRTSTATTCSCKSLQGPE